MLKEAVLDKLVDRHDRLDVFEVIEPGAIADLVQGPDGDQVGLIVVIAGLLQMSLLLWTAPGVAACVTVSQGLCRDRPESFARARRDLGAERRGLDHDGVGSKAENPALDLDGCGELKRASTLPSRSGVKTWLACHFDSWT